MLKLLARRREKKRNHDVFNLSKAGGLYPDKQRKTGSVCKQMEASMG
jgi:hypothetical protein